MIRSNQTIRNHQWFSDYHEYFQGKSKIVIASLHLSYGARLVDSDSRVAATHFIYIQNAGDAICVVGAGSR